MFIKNKRFKNLRQINASKNTVMILGHSSKHWPITPYKKWSTDNYKNINDLVLESVQEFKNIFQINKCLNIYFKSIKFGCHKQVCFVSVEISVDKENLDNMEDYKNYPSLSGSIKVSMCDENNRDIIYSAIYTFDSRDMQVNNAYWIGSLLSEN